MSCAGMDHPFNLFSRLWNKPEPGPELSELERSTAPDAPMTLFMRIQTEDGPRTVIAPHVSLAMAAQISESLAAAGHYAQFVDQCAYKENIAERLLRKNLERRFKLRELDKIALRLAGEAGPRAA
jgi:hypothetical protein